MMPLTAEGLEVHEMRQKIRKQIDRDPSNISVLALHRQKSPTKRRNGRETPLSHVSAPYVLFSVTDNSVRKLICRVGVAVDQSLRTPRNPRTRGSRRIEHGRIRMVFHEPVV